MKVLYLAAHPNEGPSTRFRLTQFFPYLKSNGIEPVLSPFFTSEDAQKIYSGGGTIQKLSITLKGAIKRLGHLTSSSQYDIIYILREAFPYAPAYFELLFKKFSGKLIFDFDDAIYYKSLAYNNPLDKLRDWNKSAKIISSSNHVVAGCEHLKNYAKKYINEDNISILPTVVDTDQFLSTKSFPMQKEGFCIGWIGTPRGSSYLKDLLPTFKKVHEKYPQTHFKFVGAEPFSPEGLPIDFKKWKLEEEISDIQSFDIGLMPLTDDEETRGKCGFKLIEYMSCGVPSVSSPVGENMNIILDSQTGFFANSPDQWAECISNLIHNKKLYESCSTNSRIRAENNYSLKNTAPKHLEILNKVFKSN